MFADVLLLLTFAQTAVARLLCWQPPAPRGARARGGRWAGAAVPLLALSVGGPSALALPVRGDPGARELRRPARSVEGGAPLLLLYDRGDSGGKNRALREELGGLFRGGQLRGGLRVEVVAGLEALCGGPLGGVIEAAARREQERAGLPVRCDRGGEVRQAYGLTSSAVRLVGGSGEVLFAADGALSAAEHARLLALIAR